MPRARVGDIELYYLLEGPPDRPVVALIPGFSAPLEMWAPTVPALVPEFRVLLYDLRGHGRSDLPMSGYDLATQASDLLGLMDELEIDKAHLVGDAAGGGIAVEIALNHPERMRSLALVGTRIHGWKAPEGSVPPPAPEEEAYNEEFQRRFKEEGLPEILEQWWLGDWARPMREDPVRRRAARFRDLILAYPGGSWQATLPSPPVPAHYPRLGEITAPTLVIVGGADLPVIKLDGEEWARCIPGARLAEIPEAGHIPNWEFPDRFNPVLAEFLREAGSRERQERPQ
jgi:pimeloyl-ACP methyl ester carboxylesterase